MPAVDDSFIDENFRSSSFRGQDAREMVERQTAQTVEDTFLLCSEDDMRRLLSSRWGRRIVRGWISLAWMQTYHPQATISARLNGMRHYAMGFVWRLEQDHPEELLKLRLEQIEDEQAIRSQRQR